MCANIHIIWPFIGLYSYTNDSKYTVKMIFSCDYKDQRSFQARTYVFLQTYKSEPTSLTAIQRIEQKSAVGSLPALFKDVWNRPEIVQFLQRSIHRIEGVFRSKIICFVYFYIFFYNSQNCERIPLIIFCLFAHYTNGLFLIPCECFHKLLLL